MGAEIYNKKGAVVTGLDISSQAIARARERAVRHNLDCEFLVGDAEKLPFLDRSFDIVAVHDGLHHLPNPYAAIAEMARVANRALIVIEPARSWLTRKAVQLDWAVDYEDAGNYVYRFREKEIFRIVADAGYRRFRYRQYLLYYQHEPFWWAKYIERTPLFYLAPLAFGAASMLAPRFGNKICTVCERV
jgi:ubiquinone/menaquinone biosynthesis C-methylase UbiE